MKKIFKNILVFGIIGLLFPVGVYAETFKSGDTTYVLEKINFTCDLFDGDEEIINMDNNYNFIYSDSNNYYKVNEDKCSVISTQEILDFYNNNNYEEFILDEYDLYSNKEVYEKTAYIKTEDSNIIADKTYSKITLDSNNVITAVDFVENPDVSEIDNYYEHAYFKRPTSVNIDSSIKYYTITESQYGLHAVKVDNPKSENILDYYILIGETEAYDLEKVMTLDSEKFADKLTNYRIVEAFSYNKNTNLGYITFFDKNSFVTYNLDGQKIDNLSHIISYSNSLLAGLDSSSEFKIVDKDYNVLYKSSDIGYLIETKYDDHVLYLKGSDNTPDALSYKLYEYKLLSDDNQVVDGKKDLEIKFSGQLDKVKTIKVNDVELNKENYNLTSGSTIVTLNKAYLDSLKDGKYSLSVEYIDGIVLASTFNKVKNPQTYDGIISSFTIGGGSLIGLIGIALYLKKKNKALN